MEKKHNSLSVMVPLYIDDWLSRIETKGLHGDFKISRNYYCIDFYITLIIAPHIFNTENPISCA